MREPLVRVADRIDLQREVRQLQRFPQAREHHDLLGVGVGALEAERLGVDLVELPVAALLRALVAEHRPARPHALRALVGEVVLDRRAHDAGRGLRAQRQGLAVELVLERVHLLLDHVGELADAADEEGGRLHDGHPDVAVAVLREHGTCGVLEALPQRRLVGQHVVHAAHGLQPGRHRFGPYASALTAMCLRSGFKCAAAGSPPYVART